MIIVSQDRTKLINFDRVEILGQDEDNRKRIGCGFNNGTMYLGEYKTEERVKEVLAEIITRYKNWENLKVGQPSGLCLPVYGMPKE